MKTAFPLVSALALLLGAAGASLAAPPQPVGGAVYTMSNAAAGNEVVVYPRAANGQLGAADRIATGGLGLGAGLGNQGGVALSDDGRWLFVVNAGSDHLSAWEVIENTARAFPHRLPDGRFRYRVADTDVHGSDPKQQMSSPDTDHKCK